MALKKLIDFAVAAIGAVLVVTSFDGSILTPPVLSGIAFLIIGIKNSIR